MMSLKSLTPSAAGKELSYATTCDPHTCRWKSYSNTSESERNAGAAVILIILFCGIICTLCLVAAIRCFLRQPQTQQGEGGDGVRKKSEDVQVVVVSGTLRMTYSTAMSGMSTECVICLTEFGEGDEIEVLERCKHGFHGKCIHHWFSTHYSCPNCRTTYLPSSTPPLS